ncbi:MAG TPA: hypothetical protein DEP28_04855 [Bacteroidetes bacterium]|nr:hypothetical protein [Bacteroidota bacterium]HCN36440.1 hypothetical protein [Bacteroidota bacterium]
MSLKTKINLRKDKTEPSFYIGIFLISLSTLLLEFTLTRILSVVLWYNFAFMVISVALLGFGISGTFLSVNEKIKKIPTDKLLSYLSLGFGISVMFTFIVMNKIPFDPFSLFSESVQFVYLPIYYLLITLPFFIAGLIISILLTKYKSEINKLYFADLVGAGLACFAFVILMPSFGGNGTIVFIAIGGFLTAIVFGFSNHKWLSFINVILIGFSLFFLTDLDKMLPINSSENKIYGNFIKQNPHKKLMTEWNTISKIDVMKEDEGSEDGYDILTAIIDDGNATTTIPNVKKLPPETKPADASNLAFSTFPQGDTIKNVFIVGSAGGGEILTSLYHNSRDITAVEINGILNDIISEKLVYWTGPLVKGNKNVNLITDDARSVLSSKGDIYDVIISAHTISSSAVSSGAMSMVENYILTQEAVQEYITHLNNEGGVLYITRPETQIPKLITSLRKAREVTSLGTHKDKNNIIVFRRAPSEFEGDKSFMGGVIYKKNGFSDVDVVNVRNEASMLNLEILYDPLQKQDGVYKDLIESDNLDEIIKNYKTDIAPATDNKPFFDNNIGFKNLTFESMKEVFSQNEKAILALKDRPVAETTLIVILIQSIIVAGFFILLPLKLVKDKGDNKFNKNFLIYFACLGIGYIMIQVCLIQKFTLFLGQPVYTLLTVISSMLIGSGIGSMFSFKFFNNSNKKLVIIFSLIAVFVLMIGIFNPILFSNSVRLELIWRIIITVIIVFPLGFFMGMPFPIGMSLIENSQTKFAALGWGINGFFSVIGTVITIIMAMTTGFTIVFITAAIIYLLALILVIRQNKINLAIGLK